MTETRPISAQDFRKRLHQLCSSKGPTTWPRRRLDRLILLKSVTLMLEKDREFTQKEIDSRLRYWLSTLGRHLETDHAHLRRFLVDEHFLGRTADGSRYWINVLERHLGVFAEEVDGVGWEDLMGPGQRSGPAGS